MTTKEEKLRDKIRKLFALMGSENTAEREAARAKIVELLGKNKKTWNDLTELLATGNAKGWHDDEPAAVGGGKAAPAPLQLINHILERHLHLTDAQRVAMTLWIAHTFKYHEFSVTPRLALISPVRGCGKTTALSIIKALSFNASKLDSITAAVLFRIIDRARACVLLDEVDNLDLLNNPALRAVITSGHHCDGAVSRCLKGEIQEFTTFAPLALAAIGKPPNPLPLPIAHRCVTIHMKRAPSTSEPLVRFDPKTYPRQKADLETVYRETFAWAQQCKLETNPPMPAELRNRPADNWRVLLAIADATSPEWGEAARAAAIELSIGQDEDLGVRLLEDIRDLFDHRPGIDRLTSAAMVDGLLELPGGLWSEWRGPQDNQVPHRMSQGGLATMLAPFGIRSRTIWPRAGSGGKSAKGYLRSQFETAWASYCDERVRPSEQSNIKHLRGA